MELDSNQEPFDQGHTSLMSFDLLLNELESTHGHIEEHIRHLEAVFRASQRQRWRNGPSGYTPVQITNITARLEAANNQDDEDSSEHVIEGATESGEPVKRGNTFLMSKAVELDVHKSENDSRGFFDCNICLDIAKDPILTCCGHLFCWGCFYQLSYAYSNAKECPVCRGEVTDTSIIPIYGNGSVNVSPSCRPTEKATMIPCRPQAQRIESVRPQLVGQQSNFLPIEERFQQFSDIVGVMRERLPLESPQNDDRRNGSMSNLQNSIQSHTLASAEIENNEQTRPSSISTLLIQQAAAVSSFSSASHSTERLTADLDSYIYDHHIGGNHSSPVSVNRESSSMANVQQSETPPPDASVVNDFEDLHSHSIFLREDITHAARVRDDT